MNTKNTLHAEEVYKYVLFYITHSYSGKFTNRHKSHLTCTKKWCFLLTETFSWQWLWNLIICKVLIWTEKSSHWKRKIGSNWTLIWFPQQHQFHAAVSVTVHRLLSIIFPCPQTPDKLKFMQRHACVTQIRGMHVRKSYFSKLSEMEEWNELTTRGN